MAKVAGSKKLAVAMTLTVFFFLTCSQGLLMTVRSRPPPLPTGARPPTPSR